MSSMPLSRQRVGLLPTSVALAAALLFALHDAAHAQTPIAGPAESATAPTGTPPADSTALDAVTVQGARESSTTRLPLTPRETPQSLSTVERTQIERQSLTSVDAVLRNVTGVSVSFYDTQRPLYYARGFQITDFQIDGLPSYSNSTSQEFDTALYERIDAVRGANGIQSGVGVPSATINLIRKRPMRQFGGSVALTAGSWSLYRGELDLNVPLTANGSVRSRFVIAPQKRDSFRDRYQEDKMAMLAVVEADVGDSTVVSLGYQRQKNEPKAPIWGTIPRFATDGTAIDLPSSTSFSPPWTRWERTTATLYATLEHQFNDNWSLKTSLARTEGDNFSLRTYGYGRTPSLAPYVNRLTGAGTTLYAAAGGGDEVRNTLDMYLSGRFGLLGQQHDLVLGASQQRTVTRTDTYFIQRNWRYDIPNIYTWNGDAPVPIHYRTGAWRNQTTDQLGLYGSARWRLTDALSVLTGVRVTNWKRQNDNYDTRGFFTGTTAVQREHRKVTPLVGVVYDITPELSAYGSYGKIFNPQNYKDRNNEPLPPAQGSNAELGLKGEWLGGRLNGHFAIFDTKQDNFGVVDSSVPPASLPDGSTAYRAVNGTRSYGFEAELGGQITPRWYAKAGLTRATVQRNANDLIYANLPEYQLQLWTHYRLGGALAPLTLGGSLLWQDEIQGFNIPHPLLGTTTVTQKPQTVLNLHATWQFNERLSATLALNNLSNRKYWANLDYGNYADPRSATLTLRAAF